MKRPKITENLSEGQGKDRLMLWKSKAIFRGQENARLHKRIKELQSSREVWKEKYGVLKKASPKVTDLSCEKPRGHQYSVVLIALILEMHKYGAMSLRSCRHCVGCMLVSLGLTVRLPSHNTIRNWVCKGGFHRVQSHQSACGEYVLYLDESIVFGSEKILLILGVAADKIPVCRAMSHSDMEVLFVGANVEWKAEHIEAELEGIAKKKKILYAVSDEGNNLRKAYGSIKCTHIEDCTHILANHLKRLYKDDADFEAFRKLIGDLRKRWNLSKSNSQYMPPMMRGKMRFANIFPCVNWAESCLKNWASMSVSVQESLAFLKEKEAFIVSLVAIAAVFKTVCSTLKNEGFGSAQKASILGKLATFSAQTTDTKVGVFIENCKGYLDNLSLKSEALAQTHLLVSSDIIESYFGKFKTKINTNNRSGLTEFIFTIANFSQSFSIEETKKAVESVKLKDLVLSKKRSNTV